MKVFNNFLTLRWRIFIGFFLLLISLQFLTLYLTYTASRENLDQQIRAQLNSSKNLFDTDWQSRTQYLQNSVETIIQDWGFRQAIGSADKQTIRTALLNNSHRIGADIALFTDMDVSDIIKVGPHNIRLTDDQRIALQENQGTQDSQIQLLTSDDKLYRVVLSPVRAPLHVGWVCMGFEINTTAAAHFKQLSSLDTSYLRVSNDKVQFISSTLSPAQQHQLAITTSSVSTMVNQITNLHNTLTLLSPLPDGSDQQLYILLSQPLEPLLSGFRSWWGELVLLFVIGALLTITLAYLIASSITNPIQRLVKAVSQVSTGNYNPIINISGSREISALSEEFNYMQRKVAQREEEILHRSSHDEITTLLNRQGLLRTVDEQFKLCTDSNISAEIAIIEVSRLQEVNHTLGHNLGDQLLLQVAQHLQEICPQAIFSYLGNSRFAAFIPQQESTQNTCEKILGIFKNPFQLQDIGILLGAHIGIAQFPEHGNTADYLLRFADIALDYTKQNHTDSAVYDAKHNSHSVFRLALLHELCHAIRTNQLQLHYQPKLDISKGLNNSHTTQVEALVRWVHPEHGFIGPDQFIPAAEQSGIITELTEWVIDQSLLQCKKWQEQGINLKIAVNISAADLLQGNLTEVIPKRLQAHGLEPKNLVLEVTESAVVEDPDKAVQLLNILREQGIGLSVDDYGTGYSSLGQLKQLPVHELKIDREFIMDITNSTDDAIIVQSTIRLGHSMGLHVTAEGIEDIESLQLLELFGCDFAQGYYICKPLPANKLEHWLNSPQKWPEIKKNIEGA